MTNFYIVSNSDKEIVENIITDMENFIKEKGCVCSKVNGYVKSDMVPEDVEGVIVLGGDGTLLQVSTELAGRNVSLIGVNFGNLGFLAEVEKEGIFDMLCALIENRYKIEPHMMLTGAIERDGKIIAEDVALNDIVINRCGPLRVMDFSVYVNDLRLTEYKADGIIVATPTGSTAYSMSAGGPIVKPNANLIVLTPICPHTLNTRSIVLEGEDIISIEINQRKNTPDEGRCVYFDGGRLVMLMSGDKVIIKKADICTNIIKLSSESFLEVLGKKMSN